jgi:hypothetical protein
MPLIIRSLNRGSQSDEAVIPPASFSYYSTAAEGVSSPSQGS